DLLVVQHLLEMRHAPRGIYGVAMKAAPDVIAHPALRNGGQRASGHLQRRRVAGARMLAKQEQQLARPRKLRRIAEPVETRIERLPKLVEGPRERGFTGNFGRQTVRSERSKLRGQGLGRLRHLRSIAAPDAD